MGTLKLRNNCSSYSGESTPWLAGQHTRRHIGYGDWTAQSTLHGYCAGKTGAPKEPLLPVRPPVRPVQSQFRPLSRLANSTVDDIPTRTESLIPASSEAAPPRTKT